MKATPWILSAAISRPPLALLAAGDYPLGPGSQPSPASREAARLYRLAQAEGKPYRPEAFFITDPEVLESVFSSTEVAREGSRATLFQDPENYHNFQLLPKKDGPEQPMELARPFRLSYCSGLLRKSHKRLSTQRYRANPNRSPGAL